MNFLDGLAHVLKYIASQKFIQRAVDDVSITMPKLVIYYHGLQNNNMILLNCSNGKVKGLKNKYISRNGHHALLPLFEDIGGMRLCSIHFVEFAIDKS
jgi:hypothetical protein